MGRIPFYPQWKNSRMCGAACLKMLYEYFGIQGDMYQIYRNVSNGSDTDCMSAKMIIGALNRGLIACCVSCHSLHETIPFCLDHKIEVITLSHQNKRQPYGHFWVVTGIEGNRLLLNDPQKQTAGENVKERFETLEEASLNKRIRDSLGAKNTLILIGHPRDGHVIFNVTPESGKNFPVFMDVVPFCENVLNPVIDRWIPAQDFLMRT